MSEYRIIGGDVGTQIIFTVREWPIGTPPTPNTLPPVVNMASATSIKLILIPPPPIQTQNAASITVTATLYTDGSDGKITYTTVSGDVPSIPFGGKPQLWHARAQYTLSGWSGKSEPDTFYVDP